MTLLNRLEVDELDYKQCQSELKLLIKTYKLDKSLNTYPQVWPILDDIVNMLCLLEDRIWKYENPNYSLMKIE